MNIANFLRTAFSKKTPPVVASSIWNHETRIADIRISYTLSSTTEDNV